MAGHSHWAGIKHKKEAADAKRGKVFSKLLAAITIAARGEPNPDFNPRLRTAIQKAKESNVPAENIERAVKRASEGGAQVEELVFEAYGPGGVALLIEIVTDNRNRAVAEIKKVLNSHDAKWAEMGSVRWAFENGPEGELIPKFPQEVSGENKRKIAALLHELDNHDDVQRVTTNALGV